MIAESDCPGTVGSRSALSGIFRFTLLALILFFLLTTWAGAETQSTVIVQPWPEAEKLFRSDPSWLGGDGASSVDLGGGRVLWLFGDSFVTDRPGVSRREAVFARNSIAIQTGYNPAQATIKFHWGADKGQPASFFPEQGPIWYWPGAGRRLDNHLLIFLMAIKPDPGPLGFAAAGPAAVLIENPDEPPTAWTTKSVPLPTKNFGVLMGCATLTADRDYLYGYGALDSNSQAVYLVRWPLGEARNGRLTHPEWWTGASSGWLDQDKIAERPPALFSEGQTEFSVHLPPGSGRYLLIQTLGFGPASLAYRTSALLIGPWSPLNVFHKPKEAGRQDILIYAAKAHPELTGADLVVTYAVNHFDPETVLKDMELYYPKFLQGMIK